MPFSYSPHFSIQIFFFATQPKFVYFQIVCSFSFSRALSDMDDTLLIEEDDNRIEEDQEEAQYKEAKSFFLSSTIFVFALYHFWISERSPH